jgi:cyclopropane fatty-acyl-phospholipid synthase-like methyltransferase
VLNPGCGTGFEARVLAQNAPVRIVAIDNHQPYVEELNRQAQVLGIAERLQGHVTDMHALEFPPGFI